MVKEPILQVKNLTYRYFGEKPILHKLSLTLHKQEKTVLLGVNGAGKSTLMFNILGIYKGEEGDISFQGINIREISEAVLRQKMAYIFQNPDDQVFATTVKEDILFGLVQFGFTQDEQDKRLNEVVELLKIDHLLKKNPRHLSYGEKRRVALAGVLVMEPEIIFFDEPMAFLDPPGRELFMSILDKLYKQGKTLVIATHDLNFAAEWGERYILLNNGQISMDGDKNILIEGMEPFKYTLPITTQIFKDYMPSSELPVTVEEGREKLKKLKEDFFS